MALEILIPIIIIALVVVFAWGMFKKLFKVLWYVGIVLMVLVGITAFFIYQDISDLRKNFTSSTKKIILVDNDEVLTGFLLNGGVNFLEDNELDELSSYLEDGNFEDLLGKSYKLMIFNLDIISGLETDEIKIGNQVLSRGYAVSILKSDYPLAMLKDKNIREDDLEITKNEAADNSKTKAALFGMILANDVLSSKNPLFFFSEYKKGNIIIYPETALFRTVKVAPLSFIKDAGKNIFSKTKSIVEEE